MRFFTLPIAEILSGKNALACVSIDFTQDKFLAPRILIFSIAMRADHSFYVKTIETHARGLLPLNISAIGSVHSNRYVFGKRLCNASTWLYEHTIHLKKILAMLSGAIWKRSVHNWLPKCQHQMKNSILLWYQHQLKHHCSSKPVYVKKQTFHLCLHLNLYHS